MSDQNPTQFENYPTEPGDMGAVTEPGPGASSAPLVVPAPPAQIADWSADTERARALRPCRKAASARL